MKRVIAISLALIMVLIAFAGCSKGGTSDTNDKQSSATKEELLEQATEVDMDDVSSDMEDNILAAKEKYFNKVLKTEGTVEIKDDHVVIMGDDATNTFMDVYLPTEELMNLKSMEKIAVVGETNDVLAEETQQVEGTKWTQYHFQMKNAYIVQDKFEIQLAITTDKDAEARECYIDVPNGSLAKVIQFAEGVDVATIPRYETITVSTKIIGGNYYEAEIIE